ncbi:hypothetical protein ABPG75_011118 [Micractinium tetrahymenae]
MDAERAEAEVASEAFGAAATGSQSSTQPATPLGERLLAAQELGRAKVAAAQAKARGHQAAAEAKARGQQAAAKAKAKAKVVAQGLLALGIAAGLFGIARAVLGGSQNLARADITIRHGRAGPQITHKVAEESSEARN